MISAHFNFPDADLVLRSSSPDEVDFHVHRCLLAVASPFFAQMLTLPQSPSCTGSPHMHTVDVSETCATLETLLRFVYPMVDPTIDTLDELTEVLKAAVKYDMSIAIESLRKLLIAPRFARTSPTRVYAIASRFDLEEEARIVSQYTLSINILDSPLHEDLKYITAYSYHRLLDLHRRRAQAAQELLQITENVKCMQCNSTYYSAVSPPKWWRDFSERAKEELRARPATDVIFSMAFLAQSAQAGCERCAGSVLDAHLFLEELKKKIDDLPSTI
ncbi:hypothetical protein B0H21DRAFT_212937 [Amylocystis lapponica]|nr:hypothetical protein B0H21DRAFT_212937 [Amylocystis lapponica]